MSDIGFQVFSAFASAIRNQSTGILKIQSGNSVRQFIFSQGSCLDVGSNVKEELPGSFLFQQKLLNNKQYENYLLKCFLPKTNQWLLANTEIQLDAANFLAQRKKFIQYIISNLKINEVDGIKFQTLEKLPADQILANGLEIFLLLTPAFSILQIQTLKPEFLDTTSSVSVVKEPPREQLTNDQAGFFTVIQHNSTLAEVLDSSFLEKEKIYQWMMAFEAAGNIRIESPIESEKRKFFEALPDDKKNQRQWIKKELLALNGKNFYEILGIERTCDDEDVAQAFSAQTAKFSLAEYQTLFFKLEENLANQILEKIRNAHAILSNPARRREYNQFLNRGATENFLDHSQTILEEKLIADYNETLATKKFDVPMKFLEEKISKYPHFIKLFYAMVDLVQKFKMTSDETLNEKIFGLFKLGIAKSPQEYSLFALLGEWCLILSQKSNALKAFQKGLNLKAGSKKLRNHILQLEPLVGRQFIVEAVYQNLENLNHFEMLGLEPTATENEIRETYREASKQFHPDRFFNTTNQSLQEMSKRVFKEMVASYLVLKQETTRKEYLEHMFSSQLKKNEKLKTTIPKSPQARRYYEQALLHVKEENLSAAKLNVQLAISYEPDNYLLQKMLKEVQSKLAS